MRLSFTKKAFNASEIMRLEGLDGKVGHAEIQIGDSRIMLADEHPQMNALAPQSPGSLGVGICLYVENIMLITRRNAGRRSEVGGIDPKAVGSRVVRLSRLARHRGDRRREKSRGYLLPPHILPIKCSRLR